MQRHDETPAADLTAAPTEGETAEPQRSLWRILGNQTFRSLKSRDYRLYFSGQIVSFTGSWMQSAALMWLVYAQTADPFWPPMMLVAQVGPTLLLGAWGGALADRVAKRRLLLWTQSAYLVNAVALTALVATGHGAAWLLLASQVVNGVVQSIDLPTRLAYVPSLVPRADLVNAVSLNSLLFNAARAVGPALAGGMFVVSGWLVESGHLGTARVETVNAVACFGLNGLSYLAVIAALWRISVAGSELREAGHERPSAWDGFRVVGEQPRLALLLVFTGALSVFAWPTLTLFPAYTRLVLNRAEQEYSVLVSALGGGALVAALISATFSSAARRRQFLAFGPALAALGLLGLTTAGEIGQAAASTAVLGFGLVLFLSVGQSTLQLSVDDEHRGRVMALWPMMLSASTLLGHTLTGLAVNAYGVPTVLAGLTAGAGLTAAAILALAWRLRG